MLCVGQYPKPCECPLQLSGSLHTLCALIAQVQAFINPTLAAKQEYSSIPAAGQGYQGGGGGAAASDAEGAAAAAPAADAEVCPL